MPVPVVIVGKKPGPNADAAQVLADLQNDSCNSSMYEDCKESFSKEVSSNASVEAALRKLEMTMSQHLSVVAAELQELHRVSFQNQTIINHLEAKVVELSQHHVQ